MNKLTAAAKELYQECYRAIEAFKNGNILESTLPMKPTRIPAAIFKNIQAFNNRRYNDTLSKYYYLGLAHRYLEKEEGLSPKEIRALSDLTRREYMMGQFLVDIFEDISYIAYLENVFPRQIGTLTIQELQTIEEQLKRTFSWKEKRKAEEDLESPPKQLETNLSEPTPDVTESPKNSTSLLEILDIDDLLNSVIVTM